MALEFESNFNIMLNAKKNKLMKDGRIVLSEGLLQPQMFFQQPTEPELPLSEVVAKAASASSAFPGALAVASIKPPHFRKL